MALEAGAQKKVSDLEEQGDATGLEALKTEAEQIDMDFEAAGAIQQAIDRLNEKAKEASTTSAEELSGVTGMDGDPAEIDKRTEEVDQEIGVVKAGAEAEVAALENSGQQTPNIELQDNVPKGPEKPVDVQEIRNSIRSFREKIAADAEGQSNLPMSRNDMIDIYNSLGDTEKSKANRVFLGKEYAEKGGSFYSSYAAEYYQNAGETQRATELRKEALEKLNEQIRSNPDDIGNYYQAANLYKELGENKKSEEVFRKLIEVNDRVSADKKSYRATASAYEALGDTENAKKMWGLESQSTPDLVYKAECLDKAGREEEAVEFYKKAITFQESLRNEGSTSFRAKDLAEAYAGVGEKLKAISMLNEEAEKQSDMARKYENYKLLEKYLD